MTCVVRYLTHPEVTIDPTAPVPSWSLNAIGKARVDALANRGALASTTQVISSGERKAIETAEIIAAKLKVPVEVRDVMHENDRSATGFLPPEEFEAMTNLFFAQPCISIRGWERAIDAQSRIVREVEQVLGRNGTGDTLIVGHGAVGTLLFCHYADVETSRIHDQPAGGGYFFAFAKEGRRVLHPWRRIENL